MTSLFVGDVDYRVTEESLMDRLNTNMHDVCLQIDKGCRLYGSCFHYVNTFSLCFRWHLSR